MNVKSMPSRLVRAALFSLSLLVVGATLVSARAVATQPTSAVMPFRAHVYFDDTTGPPSAGAVRGTPAGRLTRPKQPLTRVTAGGQSRIGAAGTRGSAGAPPDPEVLGFVQQAEVSSGAWVADLHMNLLSTVAYFGVNVNGDGTLVTGDAGYSMWWSSQETQLINAAHSAGDRVVLTIKAFNDSTIAGATGSEQARQTLINGVIAEVINRPADGVNVDFEGIDSSLAANFTLFVSELQSALNARAAGQSYLTVDTYASAGQGGTMYDLASLWHHVDALDLMGYGFEPCISGHAGPSAPMGGCWYNVPQAVSDYMTRFGVPAGELLLGVPYYGYKWNVSSTSGQDPTTSVGSADTYSGALSDFSCALQLQQHWDSTFAGPWATWFSPSSGDPCGGNHGSYRELYYDNAQSLGLKYDLVNSTRLRGIGIWALGYDSGTNDLWNEIAAKFTVTKYPAFQPHGVGAPAAAVTPDGSAQLVFWTGSDDHLTEAWYANGWNGPVSLPQFGTATSAPAVAVSRDGRDQLLFWEGPGGHLWEAWYANGWHGPVDWTAAWGGRGLLASAPSVATVSNGTQLVFWRGTDGHLWEAWYANGWNGPVDYTTLGTLASAPSVGLTPGDAEQVVFWQGTDNVLNELWYASSWHGPVEWSGFTSMNSAPSVAITSTGVQLVFYQGPGGHLEEGWFTNGWNGPADWTAGGFHGAGALASPPTAMVSADGSQQIVFWQGAGGSLWEAWYTGGWNGPVNYSG